MDDIKDVKPPIDLPGEWLLLLLIILVLAAIAGVVYFFLKRRAAKAAALAAAAVKAPWEAALGQLQELAQARYAEKGMFKVFYINLSDIVRRYLEGRFRIRAPEMTTEEFLNFVKGSAALRVEHKDALKDFLNGCDMVKFAKHQPTINEAQANFHLAKKLVEETKSDDVIPA